MRHPHIAALSILLGTLAAGHVLAQPLTAITATKTATATLAPATPSLTTALSIPGLAQLATTAYIEPDCTSGVDADQDGLDDRQESCWLGTFAPVLYLPLDKDWTMPASVDWYLKRSKLRFHHNNCSDDQILGVGAVTQQSLVSQRHQRKNGVASLSPCGHSGSSITTTAGPWDDNQHFFLQPKSDDVHMGSLDPKDWKVYGHVYPNNTGGANVQYWFLYAYNDNTGSFNHEGDWESIIVRLTPSKQQEGVYFCGHGACDRYRKSQYVTWYGSTHPTIWVADGSHASYPGEWECDNAPAWQEGPGGDNCQTNDAYRWFTWLGATGPGIQGSGYVNVGERGRPLNGQRFIDYYGQWGENGTSDTTSGPRTPSFQATWDFRRG